MQIQQPIIIDVDLKNASYINQPEVTQNDSNTFVINIFDDEIPLDLSEVTNATISHTRIDRKTIINSGTITGTNQVTFLVDRPETSLAGRVETKVQLYNADSRISTLSFTFRVNADPTSNYVPSTSERTLIEVVLGDAPLIIEDALRVTSEANIAREETIEATENAIEATNNANEKASLAEEKARLAEEKAILANTAAEKGDYAQTQGDYAKYQGDYVQEVLDIQWFPVRVQKFTSTANQTVFTLNNPYTMFQNRLQVFIEGVPQFPPINYMETSNTSFTLSEALPAGLEVVAITQ